MSFDASKHSLATPLKKVKGLGSAHSGTNHFIRQRVTAIFMVFLLLWLGSVTLEIAAEPRNLRLVLFGSILNIVFAIFFVGNFLFHGYLGLQMVIEDYVHNHFNQIVSLLCIKAFCIITFIFFVIAAITSLDSFITFTIVSRILQGLTP